MEFVEVLIADDHDWFRRAIRTVIESRQPIASVAKLEMESTP